MKKSKSLLEPTIREKMIDRIRKFVKKHKNLYFLGVVMVIFTVVVTALGGGVYRNRKRLLSIACILLFFVSSSSFSYPVLPLDVSFVSDSIQIGNGGTQNLSARVSANTAEIVDEDVPLASVAQAAAPQIGESEETAGSTAEETAKSAAANGGSDSDAADPLAHKSTEELENMPVDGNGELLGEVDESDQLSLADIVASDEAASDESEVATAENTDENSIEKPEFSEDDWKLILVNKQHPVPDDYEFPMAEIASGGKLCDERILDSLASMFEAAKKEGVTLIVCSPYRSYNRQEALFSRKVGTYMEQGFDYMESYTMASQAVTIPGSSEHELGLALDLICSNYSSLDEGFGDTKAGKWLAANSYKYGFVVRYLKGKEDITGIEYEPWHFRYVGTSAAAIMHKEGICLEEFWTEYLY